MCCWGKSTGGCIKLILLCEICESVTQFTHPGLLIQQILIPGFKRKMACGPTVFAKASNWGNYFYHDYFNSAIWTARGPLLERDWVCHHRLCAGGGCWLLHSVVASTHSLLQDLRCSGILHFWLSRKQLWVISGLKCSKPIISPQHNYWNRWSPPSAWSWNCIHGYTLSHVLTSQAFWLFEHFKIILWLQISTNL